MAEYLILIYEDEDRWSQVDERTSGKMMSEHQAFGEKHAASIRGGNALQATSSATAVRRNGSGGWAITDGAFAETKEALGGYYVIEAADLDDALRIAKDVPAPFGGIEVRPVRVFD